MSEREDVMNYIKKMMQYLGLGDAESTIYALLAISKEPLVITEISEKINYSIPRIYASISYLIKEGLVEKIRDNGMTKYTANINFIDVFEKRREEIMDKFLEPLIHISDHDERIAEIINYSKQVYNYFQKLNELKKEIFF